MKKTLGSCHCGNAQVEIELPKPLESYGPRVCDCDFCEKHGAAYISDTQGKLKIKTKNSQLLRYYHQGGGNADFMICVNCGVLIGVAYQYAGVIYGAINSKILEDRHLLGSPATVSPKRLDDDEKMRRWKEVWFPNVILDSSL